MGGCMRLSQCPLACAPAARDGTCGCGVGVTAPWVGAPRRARSLREAARLRRDTPLAVERLGSATRDVFVRAIRAHGGG